MRFGLAHIQTAIRSDTGPCWIESVLAEGPPGNYAAGSTAVQVRTSHSEDTSKTLVQVSGHLRDVVLLQRPTWGVSLLLLLLSGVVLCIGRVRRLGIRRVATRRQGLLLVLDGV